MELIVPFIFLTGSLRQYNYVQGTPLLANPVSAHGLTHPPLCGANKLRESDNFYLRLMFSYLFFPQIYIFNTLLWILFLVLYPNSINYQIKQRRNKINSSRQINNSRPTPKHTTKDLYFIVFLFFFYSSSTVYTVLNRKVYILVKMVTIKKSDLVCSN